jgi:putative glutamine amidotransferase
VLKCGDGGIEAIEAPGGTFMLGVQWHTEERLEPEGFRLLAALAGGQSASPRKAIRARSTSTS